VVLEPELDEVDVVVMLLLGFPVVVVELTSLVAVEDPVEGVVIPLLRLVGFVVVCGLVGTDDDDVVVTWTAVVSVDIVLFAVVWMVDSDIVDGIVSVVDSVS
jgi:hypothetical protein